VKLEAPRACLPSHAPSRIVKLMSVVTGIYKPLTRSNLSSCVQNNLKLITSSDPIRKKAQKSESGLSQIDQDG
jgi:hypothetical protein